MPADLRGSRAVSSNVSPAAGPAGESRDWAEAPAAASSSSGLRASLRDYLHTLLEITRWQLFSAVGLMLLTSLSEGLGVAMLFPVLQVAGLNMTNEGHVGHYTAEVRELLVRSHLRPGMWLPVLLMASLLLMALRSFFNRAQSVQVQATALKFEMTVSQRLYRAIVNAEWLFLVRSRTSNFAHALTAELNRVSSATYLFIGALSNGILFLVYVALALKLSSGMTWMVLAAGAFLLLVSRGWMRAVHESGTAVSENVSAVYSAATERLQNLKTLKTYAIQSADLEVFNRLESAALEQSLRSTKNQAAAAFWFEAGSLAVLGCVIFVSLVELRVGAASLLLLLAIFTRLMPRLAAGNSQIQAFLGELPAFENVQRIERECLEHAEPRHDYAPADALRGEIRLEEVSFAYGPDLPNVLDRVSMTFPTGEITAIAGSSGSGKSTIADLVNGLLMPDSGYVLVDGNPLTAELAPAWRRRVGYVAQDTVLFHGSVLANLLWAQPAASSDEIREALHLAAAEFAFTLPRGLDTVVGDRGILLSSGQRQRIALARALLRKPSLLILDEATNSLDLENERRILDAIEKLKGRMTILLIAHRASAIERAQTIYLVESGRISYSGDWAGLAKQTKENERTKAEASSPFRIPHLS
jgi:ATP-binding cassette subfamily C protein